ncbi:MAG: dihydropteroate synthase [Gammaproteobacteria bacterium]
MFSFAAIRDDDRPLLMGILNVTPDSFSDGGRFVDLERACAHAEQMVAEGADIIDVGGESTRPRAQPVADDVQLERVVPVIEQLRSRLAGRRVSLSIDTRSPRVAATALAAGASIANDVSGGVSPEMLSVVASHGAGLVLMHMQGLPATMQLDPQYTDVVREVGDYLVARAARALEAGIAREALAIDPGIGFGKTREHNLCLLARLDELVSKGYTVLLGTSRKRFMGAICAETDPAELLGATAATTAMAVMAGVRIVRVHDIKANRQAADVAWACKRYTGP